MAEEPEATPEEPAKCDKCGGELTPDHVCPEAAPVEPEVPAEEPVAEEASEEVAAGSVEEEPETAPEAPAEKPAETSNESDEDLPTAADLIKATKEAFDKKGELIRETPFAESLFEEDSK